MNLLKRRSASHSALSTVFTVIVIATVILLNVAVTRLSYYVSLELDLTNEQIFSLSDTAKENLALIEDEVTITFCQDRDYLQGSTEMLYIINTVEDMARENKNIHYRFINSVLEPQMFKGYIDEAQSASANIRQTDIIIEKGDASKREEGEAIPEFRHLRADSCFVSDTNSGEYWAYQGEEVLTAHCLAVTATVVPKAYYVQNHGESITEEFMTTIYNAGYDVGSLDLYKNEIPEDCRLLIVHDPRFDFDGTETSKIDMYLENNGTLMVFKSPEITTLDNLEEYLEEWGIVFGDGVVVDMMNSLSDDGTELIAAYPEQGTLGASVHKNISTAPHPAKTVVSYASPIYISAEYFEGLDENQKVTNTYTSYGNNADREISAVLASYPNATVKGGSTTVEYGASSTTEATDDVAAEVAEDTVTVNYDAPYSLMTLTRDMNHRDNETYYGYVLAAGTTQFANEKYIDSNVYANENILYYALRVMGRKQLKVPVDVKFKELPSEVLGTRESKYSMVIEGMTNLDKILSVIPLVTVIPLCMLVIGSVVIIRRRYR